MPIAKGTPMLERRQIMTTNSSVEYRRVLWTDSTRVFAAYAAIYVK